jgi:hypothetical protein
MEAYVNDAPESDYAGRASHDVVIAGERWDVKTDFYSARSKRIFVERASLEHTHASRFAYFLPTPYGFEIRIFAHQQLIDYYNAKNKVRRGDGTFFETYVYPHGVAGDQANNDGVFIGMEMVKSEGMAPWEVVKQLTQTA